MPRFRGIVLEVAPEPHHEVVDGPRVSIFFQTPDFLEDRLARHDPSSAADQVPQQIRLHQSQLNLSAGCVQLESAEVDGLAAESEDIANLRTFQGNSRGARARAPSRPMPG